MATAGYLLSPLSWWNDPIINLPLAYAFAFPFGLLSRSFFLPAMIIGYWLTNVAGFLILHHGIKNLVWGKKNNPMKKELWKDATVSLLYTLIILLLAATGWLRFPLEYIQ